VETLLSLVLDVDAYKRRVSFLSSERKILTSQLLVQIFHLTL